MKIPNAMSAMRAMPPITPPTMAPMGVEGPGVGVGVGDGGGEGEGVEIGPGGTVVLVVADVDDLEIGLVEDVVLGVKISGDNDPPSV